MDRSHWRPLTDGGAPRADCYRDLGTSEGKLSFYGIDEAERDLHDRLLAATLVSTGYFQTIDFATVDSDAVDALGLTMRPTPGTLPDSVVNARHVDVEGLTLPSLAELAANLAEPIRRYNLKEVADALVRSFDSAWLDRATVPENILARLESHLAARKPAR